MKIVERIFQRLGQYPTLVKMAPYSLVAVATGVDRAVSFATASPESLLFTVPAATLIAWRAQVALSHRIELTQVKEKAAGLEGAVDALAAAEQKIMQLESKCDALTAAEEGMRRYLQEKSGSKVDFGKYMFIGRVGEGGMAIAVKVIDNELGVIRVLKIPGENLLKEPNELERFKGAEARSLAKLNHSGIVRFYSFGEMEVKDYLKITNLLMPEKELPAKIPYIEMEFIAYDSLDKRISKIKEKGGVAFPPNYALKLALSLARTLKAVHAENIVHRDLKPGNIFVVPDENNPNQETTKISDFGLAMTGTRYTLIRSAMGTPEYMPPEQWRAEHLDWTADQYALGAILYEMISGKPPFGYVASYEEKVLREYGNRVEGEALTRLPENSTEGLRIWEILQRMLARDKAARYQNWDDCVADLEQVLGKTRPTAKSLTIKTPLQPTLYGPYLPNKRK
jgi:serine/threonine-protein kinase